MRRTTTDRIAPILVVGGALAALPTAAGHFFARDKVSFGGELHFVGVGMTAVAATAAAIALTILGARRQDGRAVLIGTAFSVMAALLALHGIATPDILMGYNGVVSFTGGAPLPIGGAILALAALPQFRRPTQVRPLIVVQAILLFGVLCLGITGFLFPQLVPGVPEPGSAAAITLLIVGLAFYGAIGWRAFRTFLLTHRHADLLVVIGIAWLAAAIPPAMLLRYNELGWWLGHGFELVGIGIVGAHVRSLLVSLAEKDAYTEEHTRRVALRAVQVGEELGLSPLRLRELATGAIVHDVGKLAVPDSILKKPDKLTPEEFQTVQRHSETGYRTLKELGFRESVRQLVLDHHERLDGSGYPRGLSGPAITLDARILAVCDVHDALISTRVYREAWSHERAIGLLHEEAGTKLDRRCVSALERVLTRERVLVR